MGDVVISERLRRSLLRSSERAAQCGKYELSAVDLVHGMLGDPDAVAVEAMRAVGLDIPRLQFALEDQSRAVAAVPFDTFHMPRP